MRSKTRYGPTNLGANFPLTPKRLTPRKGDTRRYALYGRRCRTPLLWDEVGDRQLFGPDLIKESEEKVKLIRDRLKVAQSHQKDYADLKCKEVAYEVGDRAYLRVSPL